MGKKRKFYKEVETAHIPTQNFFNIFYIGKMLKIWRNKTDAI